MTEKILLEAIVVLDFLLARHKSAEETAKVIRKIESGLFTDYLTSFYYSNYRILADKRLGSAEFEDRIVNTIKQFRDCRGQSKSSIGCIILFHDGY